MILPSQGIRAFFQPQVHPDDKDTRYIAVLSQDGLSPELIAITLGGRYIGQE